MRLSSALILLGGAGGFASAQASQLPLSASSSSSNLRSILANSISSLLSPLWPSSQDSQTLAFTPELAIHHSLHDDHIGKSATWEYPSSEGLFSSLTGSSKPVFGGIKTKKQAVTRLADPRAYLSRRADILSASRISIQSGGPAFAAQSIDELHSEMDWTSDDLIVPDVESRSTLLAMARMSSAAYEAPPDTPSWKPTPGFDDWNISDSFGWIDDGIRGHVFASGKNKDVIVVALKGTSASILPGDGTSRRDKLNDNLLFSCCCARVSWAWSPVCPCPFSGTKCSQPCLERSLLHQSVYYPLITDLYNNISYRYPQSQIWVTGHSLGGALASLMAYTFGVPAVTFESPAERMAAKRLHLPLPPGSHKHGDGKSAPSSSTKKGLPLLPITHVFHTADPIAMGTCTGPTSLCGETGYAMESVCHAGQTIIYNTTGLLGWSSSVNTHRITYLADDLLLEDWGDRVRREYKGKSESTVATAQTTRWSTLRWPWRSGDESKDPEKDKWLEEIGEVPNVTNQDDCVDCGEWEFVDEDKTK